MAATVAWPLIVAVLAVAGMTLGTLATDSQEGPRRLLGWSAVSQGVSARAGGQVDGWQPWLAVVVSATRWSVPSTTCGGLSRHTDRRSRGSR